MEEKDTRAFATLVQASLRLWSKKLSLVPELHRQYRCPFSYSDAAEDAFPGRYVPQMRKGKCFWSKTRVLQPVMVHGQPQRCSTRYKLRPQRVSTHYCSKKRTKGGRSMSFQGTLQVCR